MSNRHSLLLLYYTPTIIETSQSILSDFGNALIFIIGAMVFVAGGLLTYMILRPYRPSEQKDTVYECGEDAIGDSWGNFNVRFYIIALIFLLFDVEIAFLFPWATVFGNAQYIQETNGLWGWFSLFEVFTFISILTLGLVYAWVKGYLDFETIKTTESNYKGSVPQKLYDDFNQGVIDQEQKIKKAS